MINPNVIFHLETSASRYDLMAKAVERTGKPSAPALAAYYREVASDYRYLVALAQVSDDLIAEAVETLPEQLLADREDP